MHNKNQIGSFVLGKFAGKIDFIRTIAALSLSLLTFATPAYSLDLGALPTGYQSVSGNIQFNQSGNTLDVTTAANRSIANYNTFNIGSNATVNFNLPDSNSVILNRVTGGSASEIMGRINSNGQVFLANPSGILFGSSAQVNVGSLLTSTLNIKDSDFLAGQYIFNQLSQPASIVNQGNINVAPGGYVAMIGGVVRNDGTINAPEGKVRLVVGDSVKVNIDSGVNIEVTIDQSLKNKVDNVQDAILNTGNIITNGGSIKAQVKLTNALYEKAVNNQGLIQANNINNKDGVIELIASSDTALAGDISNSGKLLSNGGNILVLGNDINFSGGNTDQGLKSRDAAIFASGSINLGSAVNASNLSLRAGSGIDASARIISNNTSILSKDSVNLSNAENNLLKISANVTGRGSSLNIVEKNNIQVDGVNSIEGITTNDGDVSISAGNNIVLWRPINVGSGTINLSAGDNIQQNAGMFVANTLTLSTLRGSASGFIDGAIFTDINNLSMNSKSDQGSFRILNVKDKSLNILDSKTGNQGLIDVEVEGSGTINVLGSLDAGQVNLVSATNTRKLINSNTPVNSISFTDGQFLSAVEQEITNQLNGGKTSGSQSGSSTTINDAILRQIIEEFKNNAKTRTWEEYKAEMISKGYTVDVEFTHQFVAQLADGRTASVTVNGSAKEMYENFRQQSLNAEKLAAEQRIQKQTDTINWTNSIAQKEIKRRNEWNDFTSIEKRQINIDTATKLANQVVGRNQTERNNAIKAEKRKLEEAKKKAEYDLWWNSLTPEQKAEYIAVQDAEKLRQQQEEAARKQKELEQYMNQYDLDWKAEFTDKPVTETPKTDTPPIPPIIPALPTILLTPPIPTIPTIPIMSNTPIIRVIPNIPTQIVDPSGLTEIISTGKGIVNGSIANISAQPSVQTPLFYVETPEEDSPEELVQLETPVNETQTPLLNQPVPEELSNVKKPVYYYPGMW